MVTKDCINGTWFPKGHFGRTANYSDLIDELGEMRENKKSREPKIHLEAELMIYNRTKYFHCLTDPLIIMYLMLSVIVVKKYFVNEI